MTAKGSATWRWLEPSEWDELAVASPAATWFHRRDWAEAICAHDPRFEPRALGLETARGDWALMPLAARRGLLRRGRAGRAASMQPGVYGGPVVAGRLLDRDDWSALLAALADLPLGRIECYDNVLDPLPEELLASSEGGTASLVERRETHVIELEELPEDPRASYNRGCRNSIAKAERGGLWVERARSAEAVAEYHALYLGTVRRWGQPLEKAYGRALFEDLVARPGAELWLARTADGRPAAGGVFLFAPRHCVYWHGAMEAELQELRPANLLMHRMVCEARARGCELFDFNPSRGLEGVLAFKRSFRAEPRPLLVWRHERGVWRHERGVWRHERTPAGGLQRPVLAKRSHASEPALREPARETAPGGLPRIPLELGSAAGFRYGELPPEIEGRLESWLAAGEVPAGPDTAVLKPGRVWRVGGWAVKLYPRRGRARDWLRRSPALRAAELARLLPIRTPRPLVALESKRVARPGPGLGVAEFLEGLPLHAAWDADPASRAALPGFLAAMHAAGVFHGDLNSRNLLWSDGAWALLDLEGIRRGLAASLPGRLVEAQWVRVIATLRGRPGSRELFEAYLAQTGSPDPAGARWSRIEARARAMVGRWDERRGGPPPDLPEAARWR